MISARRKNLRLRARPIVWSRTLCADHLSSSDLKVDKQDFSRRAWCFSAPADHSKVIPVMSRMAFHMLMHMLRISLVFSFSDNVPELKSGAYSKVDASSHEHP